MAVTINDLSVGTIVTNNCGDWARVELDVAENKFYALQDQEVLQESYDLDEAIVVCDLEEAHIDG